MAARELSRKELIAAFVELTDTLADDFDIIDFLHRLCEYSAALLSIEAAGLVLLDAAGAPQAMAAIPPEASALQAVQIQDDRGPCLDVLRTGRPVIVPDATKVSERWPGFSAATVTAGLTTCNALPMRLRDDTIGSLALFSTGPATLLAVTTAQAFADVATIALLQHRALQDVIAINRQLSVALDSRTTIEQAKGIIAERDDLSSEDAFTAIRAHARNRQTKLTTLANDIIHGRADIPTPPDRP